MLDPIDGTRAFITGRPLFGTLVGLLDDGVPILGVIDQPVTGERWIGGAGPADACFAGRSAGAPAAGRAARWTGPSCPAPAR